LCGDVFLIPQTSSVWLYWRCCCCLFSIGIIYNIVVYIWQNSLLHFNNFEIYNATYWGIQYTNRDHLATKHNIQYCGNSVSCIHCWCYLLWFSIYLGFILPKATSYVIRASFFFLALPLKYLVLKIIYDCKIKKSGVDDSICSHAWIISL